MRLDCDWYHNIYIYIYLVKYPVLIDQLNSPSLSVGLDTLPPGHIAASRDGDQAGEKTVAEKSNVQVQSKTSVFSRWKHVENRESPHVELTR